MANFSSGSSGPPDIFDNGQLRDVNVPGDFSTERWDESPRLPGPEAKDNTCPRILSSPAASREAAQIELPPSPTMEPVEIPILGMAPHEPDQSREYPKASTPLPDLDSNKNKSYNQSNNPADDILVNFPTIFRLLDLYQEQGSGGLVEKVLIDQDCLRRLLNALLPGSYDSVSKIDFKALDKCTIKPMGIYGSKLEIVRFLREINCLNVDSERVLLSSIGSSNDLRSGIYLALPLDRRMKESNIERAYILYWPEDSTWDDKAISSVRRNRITFMRYLSKLTDQMVALVSPEQASAMVWTLGRQDANGPVIQSEVFDESRMFSFEVEKSTEQEEDAIATTGFKLNTRKMHHFKDASKIRLVSGEEKVGLMTSLLEPATTISEKRNETMFSATLRSMIAAKARPIVLGDLTGDQLKILAQHGLREAYPEPFAQYEKRMSLEEDERRRQYERSIQVMEEGIRQDRDQLKHLIGLMVRERYSNVYPSLGIHTPELGSPEFKRLRERYLGLADVPRAIKKSPDIRTIADPEFQDLKLAWHTIRDYLIQDPPPASDRQAAFVKEILGDSLNGEWSTVTREKGNKHGFKFSLRAVKEAVSTLFGYDAKHPATLLPDSEFVQALRPLAGAFPVLSQLTDRISTCLHAYLDALGKRIVREILEKVVNEEERRLKDLIGNDRRRRSRDESEASGRVLLNDLRSILPFNDKFLQLIRDKCLVIVAGPNQFDIYIDDNVRLPHIIEQGTPKRSIKYDRVGDPNQCIFAFDEGTRLLGIFHSTDLKGPELSLYGFDETLTGVQARGSPFSLKEWYDAEVKIEKICFVSGAEEICLIEVSGRARVLSLVTLNFRPASVQISGSVIDAFSAPDGSCLLVSVASEEKSLVEHKLLVFHWASFGATQSGISPTVLPCSDVGRVVTSFEGRNNIHLVSFSIQSMTVTSVALLVKQKATEFSFRSNQTSSSTLRAETVNNCLIDCHMDVWTRFPVAPAVTRSTLSSLGREPRKLVYASSSMQPVDSYFSRMITKFERTTCKPIDTELRSISVVAFSDRFDALVQNIQCSKYPVGSFIVEFICLIPLHLAITRDNRFIPLKDGVWDPEHERSLLGADVPAIINSLSIGWYESLFQSYMATKPVRVVSLMGEQSVGKSYCLNHFADTTFAGSAMRTTEGVWLSCTPTNDYLLVSLDFEGVHSIERSAQEDALLVLFNTAISNLSTLAIIIKDVTDSDSKDIVKEFSLKFQKIVQKEQEQNFISRLHRGRVQIIPWPVINSSSFYTLFIHLRRYLDTQPITHPSGGIFLHNMKTLMAKIKASDWGSLDQNLAAHRAQQLERSLHNALSRGSTDQDDIRTPLRNLDTDEDVPVGGPDVVFFVPDISGTVTQGDEAGMEGTLETLVRACLASSNVGPRHIIGDRAYIESLQQDLFGLLDQRLEHVRCWVQLSQCVPQFDYAQKLVRRATISAHDHTDIQGDTNVAPRIAVRSHATYPRIILSRSDVDCLQVIAQNTCATSKLIHADKTVTLAIKTDAPDPPGIDAPDSATYRGTSLTHATAVVILARALWNANSVDVFATSQIISMDWTPKRFTFVAKRTAVQALARQGGFVELIETQPSTVEERFSGRHETFQYTRYTQVEQRLTCVIPIPPSELRHVGEHAHTTDENAFHYCNERCPSCQYLCTLPLGHPQQLHETSHGSMTTTQWAIQGTSQDARYELNGRNFGIGDEGAPMLCHLVCSAQGRHAHIDFCREPDNCRGGAELEHISDRMHPEPDRPKDWISHRLKWARSGFQDPYSREQQAEFAKCSGSMGSRDRTPLENTPVSQQIRTRCNNRYGAVLSALHSFWLSREGGQPTAQPRQDAYSVITFNDSPTTRLVNDFTSTTNQLLSQLLQNSAGGGTNFNSALSHAQSLIRTHWNSDKACVQLGKPLAFYSVSFGPENSSGSLREMVQIAREVYTAAPRNALANIQGEPCAYYSAIDSIQLANTFLGISNSLHKPRASLIGQSSGRRAI
ncbi:hypothetical protein OPQ81_003410 [Rhizoctonia solani]|nr:hypothetical protein OPQ81_003410 [Rhizoctonia solani]